MATQLDLFNLIFQEILKISPTLLSKYYTVQDQVLYLILIPHVLLFLFIYAFSFGLVARFVGSHKGFSILLGIVIYLYMIWNGWYGTWIVPMFITWFTIALVAGLILFGITFFIHPARGPSLTKLAGEIGKEAAKKAGRGKQIEELEDELKFVRKRMKDLKDTREANPAAAYEYENYKRQEEALKNAIKKLGG